MIRFRSLFSKKVRAFSLIELGIVLIIMGVIAGAIFKGQDLLQVAKMNSVLEDLKRYRNAISLYQQTYGEWPGDDPKAATRFEGGENGNGDGVIDGADEALVWKHLMHAGSLSHGDIPSSKMGGKFRLASNPHADFQGVWLLLGQGAEAHQGIITPKQAQMLKNRADDGKPTEGLIRFMNGEGGQGNCLNGDQFDLTHNNPVCVLLSHVG